MLIQGTRAVGNSRVDQYISKEIKNHTGNPPGLKMQ